MADSDFGKEIGLIHKMIITGRKVGAGRAFYTALADNEKLFKKIIAFVSPRKSYKIKVNYELTTQEMLEDFFFNKVNSNITSRNIPAIKQTEKELRIELIHFDFVVNTTEAKSGIRAFGLRPATLPEFLALIKKYPRCQTEFPVAVLGTVLDLPGYGPRSPVFLNQRGFKTLDLGYNNAIWYSEYRFVAVRLD